MSATQSFSYHYPHKTKFARPLTRQRAASSSYRESSWWMKNEDQDNHRTNRELTSVAVGARSSPHRGLHIEQFTRAASGVWYYQVDISIQPETTASHAASSATEQHVPTEVLYYSVLRRYSDFLHLYEKVKRHLNQQASHDEMPPFPGKELISLPLLNMIWSRSTPVHLLEERRGKFEALLQWIEHHPVAREATAYLDFLGQPPQCRDGYVSLKDYTSPNWLASLQQLAKDKEERRRKYTMDSADISSLIVATKPAARTPQRPVSPVSVQPSMALQMRREQYLAKHNPAGQALRKRARSLSDPKSPLEAAKYQVIQTITQHLVARMESNYKKRKKGLNSCHI